MGAPAGGLLRVLGSHLGASAFAVLMIGVLISRVKAQRVLPRAYRAEPMPTVQLSSGHKMPQLGLGTWKSAKGEVAAAVRHAISVGYRHIDCAAVYANEHEVGHALHEALSSGAVRREELFVTSKLWNSMHAPSDVPKALKKTLRDLRLEYLDLYLIHWPVTGKAGNKLTPSIAETWAAMEALVRQGTVRSIGVSNFSERKLRELLQTAVIKPAVNQVELHPLWRQDGLLAACTSMGVRMTAYSPLGSPDSAHIFKHDGAKLLQHPTVQAVAERRGRSAGQVLIRWALQRGTVVIPKSVHARRIEQNLDVLSWSLSEEDMAQLSSLEPQHRMIAGHMWLSPKGPYRTMADLWDE